MITSEQLTHAAKHGNLNGVLKYIEQTKNDTNKTKKFFNHQAINIAFHIATEYGRLDCIKALLQAGADVDYQDFSGRTALTHAVVREYVECVHVLIQAGADINHYDKHGYTILTDALSDFYIHKKDNNIAEILVKAGVDLYYKDIRGHLALYYSARNPYAQILYESRAQPWYPELSEYYPTAFCDRAEALIVGLNIRDVLPLELVFEVLVYTADEYNKNC